MHPEVYSLNSDDGFDTEPANNCKPLQRLDRNWIIAMIQTYHNVMPVFIDANVPKLPEFIL